MDERERIGAHVRAARAYADLPQTTLADALGCSVETYQRIEGGLRLAKPGERLLIAQMCGVPVSFLTDGFVDVAEVRKQVATIQRNFDLLVRSGEEADLEAGLEAVERAPKSTPGTGPRGERDPRSSGHDVPQRPTRRRRRDARGPRP